MRGLDPDPDLGRKLAEVLANARRARDRLMPGLTLAEGRLRVAIRDLERRRDDRIVAVLSALRAQDYAAGAVVLAHERALRDRTALGAGDRTRGDVAGRSAAGAEGRPASALAGVSLLDRSGVAHRRA